MHRAPQGTLTPDVSQNRSPQRPDASSSDDRQGAERSRRLAAGIATAVAGRALGVVVPLLLIPVTLSYLGPERYGLWAAVLALAGMAAFADLGLGNGLMTKLTLCHGAGDSEGARRYLSSAYFLLVPLAVMLCVLLWLMAPVVPWASLLGLPGNMSPADVRGMVLVGLTAVVLNIPLSLIIRVQYAFQQVSISNMWQAAGAVLALPLVLSAVWTKQPPVIVVGAAVIGPLLANLANSVWVYGHRIPEICPRLSQVDRTLARRLLRLSGMFFVLTVVMSAANNADTLIIAQTLGLEQVTAYAVPAKVLAQAGMLVGLVNVPLWPANGEALARHDLAWVYRTVRRMTLISTAITLVPSVVLVILGGPFFAAWLSVPLGGDRWLLGGLALWWVLLAGISPRFMVQNAMGVVRPQLLGWVAYLVLSLIGKWWAATLWGITALPYVAVAAYLITVLPAAIYGYRRALTMSEPQSTEREVALETR
ncbi:lipopolysaccharide biosynthesis protein [Micromonospora sp. MH99]|uniref:lipopolysaccharide biosynthesis protein n=1 Tax=Micromonospora sp. MH99 TaxID=1945510 RepID=UPI002103F754|nr:oligosaccharide flippase family protein [Micromonospora sp. MH99]